MAARGAATRTKLAHDACQPFSPIAWAEGSAILGDALDEYFFGCAGNHRIVAVSQTRQATGSPHLR